MSIGTFLEESDINLASLSIELERATIANSPRGEHALYVHERGMYPFWVEIRPKMAVILLHSYVDFQAGTEELEQLQLSNQINSSVYIPSFHVRRFEQEDGPDRVRLIANYPIFYRDGLITSQFVRLCHIFSRSMQELSHNFDPEQRLLQED